MSCYAIFIRRTMTDKAEFQRYSDRVGKTFEGHPAKILVAYGQQETLEGDGGDGAVVIEFPDRAAAHVWYNGPDYQEVLQHRLRSCEYDVIFVDGI